MAGNITVKRECMNYAVTKTRGPGYGLVRKFTILFLIMAGLCMAVSATGDVPELTITGPLVPGEVISTMENTSMILAPGTTVDYTSDGILHFYLPNGSEQFTAQESNARTIRFVRDNGMSSLILPATRVLAVKEPSIFSQQGQHTLAIISTGGFQKVLTLHDEVNVTSPVTYLIGDGGTGYTQLTEVDGNLMIVDGFLVDQPAGTGNT
jgi:hypothetical protein